MSTDDSRGADTGSGSARWRVDGRPTTRPAARAGRPDRRRRGLVRHRCIGAHRQNGPTGTARPAASGSGGPTAAGAFLGDGSAAAAVGEITLTDAGDRGSARAADRRTHHPAGGKAIAAAAAPADAGAPPRRYQPIGATRASADCRPVRRVQTRQGRPGHRRSDGRDGHRHDIGGTSAPPCRDHSGVMLDTLRARGRSARRPRPSNTVRLVGERALVQADGDRGFLTPDREVVRSRPPSAMAGVRRGDDRASVSCSPNTRTRPRWPNVMGGGRGHGAGAGDRHRIGALLIDGEIIVAAAPGVVPAGHHQFRTAVRPCGKRGCWERYCSGTALADTVEGLPTATKVAASDRRRRPRAVDRPTVAVPLPTAMRWPPSVARSARGWRWSPTFSTPIHRSSPAVAETGLYSMRPANTSSIGSYTAARAHPRYATR